jgi:hypothetical protein
VRSASNLRCREDDELPDRWSDYVSLFVAALALGNPVNEIDRRWWELLEVFDVLDADGACITAELENMVARLSFGPTSGVGSLESLINATQQASRIVPARLKCHRLCNGDADLIFASAGRPGAFRKVCHCICRDIARLGFSVDR